MIKAVVILLSDKRSGSTMLERELCRHPGIQHIRFTPHSYNESHFWLKSACLLSTDPKGFSGGVRPNSYGSPSAIRKSLVSTVQGNVPDFQIPTDDRELVFKGWEALCEEFAHPVFFEKSPQHPHHWAALELILEWAKMTEYTVRFIGLVRNPMAVMYSAQQLFFTEPEKRQFGWVTGNRNIQKLARLVGPEQFLWMKYENLIGNPDSGFKEICELIGVLPDSKLGQSVNADSLYKWREDSAFQFQLDPEVAIFAREFGYLDEELINPPKPQLGIGRRVFRNLRFKMKRAESLLYNSVKRHLSG